MRIKKSMPTYRIKNKKTGVEYTTFMTIAELDALLKEDSNLDVIPGTPLIHTGFRKTPAGFRDVLKQIKKNHPGSTIKT